MIGFYIGADIGPWFNAPGPGATAPALRAGRGLLYQVRSAIPVLTAIRAKVAALYVIRTSPPTLGD